MVLSCRAFIGELLLTQSSREFVSNDFLRRHWTPIEIASSSKYLSGRAVMSPEAKCSARQPTERIRSTRDEHSASSSSMIATRGLVTGRRLARCAKSSERNRKKTPSRTELGSSIVWRSRQGGQLYNRGTMCMASSLWQVADAPGAAWQRKVQPNHAFGIARSQSLGCDGQAHTLVWASMMQQAPAPILPQAHVMGGGLTSGRRGPPLSERASLRILLPIFA